MTFLRRFSLLLIMLPTLAFAGIAPRTVLVESFTNVSCGGCYDANATTKQYMDDHGRNEVINLQYHVNWPHPADPYYLVDPDGNMGRTMYYMIANAPSLKTDGATTAPNNYALMDADVQASRATASPMRINVTQQRIGLTLDVDVDVIAVGDVGNDMTLRVAVVEESDHQAVPPGSNGETDFYWTMRRMLPDHSGSAVSVTEGGTQSFTLSTTLDAAWADTDCYVVAWVQNDTSRKIIQAATTAPAADYAMDFYAERFGLVAPVGELSHIDSYIENTGTQTDTYDVHLADVAPGDWVVAACAGPICYPPWIRDFTVTLAPGESILILIDVTPGSGSSSGEFVLTVTSQSDGAVNATRSFGAIAPGADVLFVDADAGYPYETYFTDALTGAGATWSSWDRNTLGFLTATDLANFPAVVWNAELAAPAVSDQDRTAIATYLANQGSLLLSGQDIAFDLVDPASPNYSLETKAWYEDHTGASFVADDSHDTSLVGVSGDPIGDGLIFNIAGGSGANNQGYPDVLNAAPSARAIVEYSPGNVAGVRFLLNSAHIVTLGFGFEGIDTDAHRTLFMQRILDWFAVTEPTPVNDVPGLASIVGDAQARPNPFNPSTRIVFSLEGIGQVPVQVDVYDLRGQRVRRLHDGPLAAGDHALSWDGRNTNGQVLSSGTYLARVRAGEDVRSLKLVLSK